ncbi:hypothetical protein ACFQX6_32225 [Streptosporangium lutulentum]
MITRSKHLAILTTALMLGAGLAACGSDEPESAGGKTTITFWDDNGGPARTPVWQHIIAEFQKANPTIEVKYVGIPIAQVQQKYDTAIAAAACPMWEASPPRCCRAWWRRSHWTRWTTGSPAAR